MAETGAASAPAPAQKARQIGVPARAGTTGGLPLHNLRALASILALGGTTLAAEVFLPAGVWAAALHLTIVFLGLWLAKPRDVYVLAAIASALVVIGAALTGAAGASVSALLAGPGLANRLIVLLGIWAVAAALAESKRRETSLRIRLAREYARRQAVEAEIEQSRSVTKPSDLADRIGDSRDLGHEVRTLLNAIVGFSEAAKAEIFGPITDRRYRDYMGHVNESGWALLRVFERHLAAGPQPEKRPDPGTRRAQDESEPAEDDQSKAATAINE